MGAGVEPWSIRSARRRVIHAMRHAMSHAGTMNPPRFRVPRIKVGMRIKLIREGGGGGRPPEKRQGWLRRLLDTIRSRRR